MNPLTNVKNVKKLSEAELKGRNKTSWHDQYRGSAWLFIGGLPYDLTEGDIVCVFSQYGEPVNINLVREKDSGKSKGYCFLCYEDQRSTDLAVDNLNGIKLLGRTLRVDHVEDYRPPKERKEDDEETKTLKREGLAGVSVRTIKREEVSTVKVEVKRELSPKRKVKVKKEKSESESESDNSKNTKKKKHLKKKKTKKVSSSSSDTSSESDESANDKIRNKRKRKKSSSSSSSDSDSSDSEPKKKSRKLQKPKGSQWEEISKKGTKKHSKTVEELKREAQLIQEELLRRQKAKDEADLEQDDRKHRHEPAETKHKSQGSPPRSYSEVLAQPPRSTERHDKYRRRSRSSEKPRKRSGSQHTEARNRSKTPDKPKHARSISEKSRRRSRSMDRPARRSRSPRVVSDRLSDRHRPERFMGRDVRSERYREVGRPRSPHRGRK